jgi:threonine dehydrogenase-like Zn-dependent dehydrogenase
MMMVTTKVKNSNTSSTPTSTMMMKAAVYRDFNGPIRIEDVPVPTLTDDDQVGGGTASTDTTTDAAVDTNSSSIIVKVEATGVCRSDWHGWKGHDSDIIGHGLPFVPGHEFAGVVVQTGRQVQRFRPGDRVAVPFILVGGYERLNERNDITTYRSLLETDDHDYIVRFEERYT